MKKTLAVVIMLPVFVAAAPVAVLVSVLYGIGWMFKWAFDTLTD